MTEGSDTVADALAAHLAEVAGALDLAPVTAAGLGEALQAFARDAALAVRSLVGLSLVHEVAGGTAVVTALPSAAGPADVAASLQIPVQLGAGVGARCAFVLYADQPGAFVELADTLRASLGEESDQLLVDQHLELPLSTDLSAFRHAAVHDMAEGVLIGRGFTEAGAATFLETLTAASGGDATAAARQVMESVR